MNIKKLTIENINCLVGKWVIDFEHSDFAGQKFFAIIGNVGSGKSTILDSICLSLYGQTTRCDRGKPIANLVNSNQKSGRVELVFEIEGRTYCSSWSCTKNKNLKTEMGSYEISQTGEKINACSGLDEVRNKNIKILGMEFVQFTQSILLAQGEFRKFFEANTDKKAELLGKITGNDLYELLPGLVAEKRKILEKELEELNNNPNCEGLLDEETVRKKHNEQLICEKQRKELKDKLQEIESQLKLLEACEETENVWKQAVLKLNSALSSRDQFISQLQKLEDGERAQLAEKLHVQYETKQAAFDKICAKYAELESEIKFYSACCQNMQKYCAESQAKKQKWSELYLAAGNIFAQKDKEVLQLENLRQAWRQKDQEVNNLCAGIQSSKTQAEAKLKEINYVKDSLKQFAQKVCRQIAQTYESVENILSYDHVNLAEAISSEFEQQKCILSLESEVTSILSGQDRRQFANQETILLEQATQWQKLLDRMSDLWLEVANLCKCTAIYRDKTVDYLTKQTELEELEQQLKEAQERKNVAIVKYEAVQEIDALSGYRLKLQASHNCPLCGALEHPYAGQIEKTLQEQLEKAYLLKEKAEREVGEIEQKLKEIDSEKHKLETELAVLERENEASWHKIGQILLSVQENNLSKTKEFTRLNLSVVENCWHNFETKRLTVEQLLEEVNKLNESVALGKEYTEQIFEEANQALLTYRCNKQKLVSLEDELNLAKQLLDLGVQLTQTLNLAGLSDIELDIPLVKAKSANLAATNYGGIAESLGQSLKSVASLKEKYYHAHAQIEATDSKRLSLLEAVAEKEQKLNELKSEIGSLKEEGQILAESLEKSWQQLERLWQEGAEKGEEADEALRQARNKVSAKTFAEAKKKFDDRKAEKEREVHDNQLKLASHEAKLNSLKGQWQKAEAEKEAAEKDLSAVRKAFANKLQELSFIDESDWQAKYLPAESLAELRAQKASIDSNIKSADDSEKAASAKFNEAKIQAEGCLDSKEELQHLKVNVNAENDKISEQIGQLNEILQKHAIAAENAQKLAPIRQQKEKETAKWQLLSQVLGDQQGKKFNKFVQGLTFRLLLARTNERLHDLTDRYELAIKINAQANKNNKDDNENVKNELDLEFSVLDKYQSIARDSRNLSGGESFLVSLAMALALSDLASQRRDINSLFLDEGFGTLDSETLSIVLRALTALGRQDKMIGVVSHISEVSENIPAQLELKRNGDGTSKIVGHYMQVEEIRSVVKKARAKK